MSHIGVLSKLHQHHRAIRELFREIHERIDLGGSDYGRLYESLRRELLSHSAAEDTVFFGALAAHAECREDVRDGREEHEEIEELIHELDRAEDEDEWVAAFQELEDSVEHHIHEVEGETFGLATRVLDESRLQGLAAEYQRERGRARSASRGVEPDDEDDDADSAELELGEE